MNKQSKSIARQFFDYFQLSDSSEQIDDASHPHRRRFLPAYQNRLSYVRDAWLYYLSAILLLKLTLPFIAITFLLTTFLSFAFLEETPYPPGDED